MQPTVPPAGPSGPRPQERSTGRVEAFSDGVFAVLITLTALELKAPIGHSLGDLRTLVAPVLVYLLSFAFIGVYWNNHHQLLRSAGALNGWLMWANLHLLFWLSLVPVLTEWVGRGWDHTAPAATYAAVALAAGAAYSLLRLAIRRADGRARSVAEAFSGSDRKEIASLVGYASGLALAWAAPIASYVVFALIAVMWIVPVDAREGAAAA